MASDDIQIVSVEEVQCLCLDRRPEGKRKEAEWTSGSGRKTPVNVTRSSRKGKHRQRLSTLDTSDASSIVVIDDQNDVHMDGVSHIPSSSCGPLKPIHLNSDCTDDVIVISGMSQPTEQSPKALKREGSSSEILLAGLKNTSSLSLSEGAQCSQQQALDIALAQQLQYEENSKLVVVSTAPATTSASSSPSSSSTSSSSSSSTVTTLATTSSSKTRHKSRRDTQVEVKIVSSSRIIVQDKVPPPPKKLKNECSSHLELPVYWTKCSKPKRGEERYSLADVDSSSQEWSNVCGPMICANFFVTQLQRIENPSLWERLQCERQLMARNHPKSFEINERLLYHTSRANTTVICEEGLDQRLSRSGNFGRGIYFSDNPVKCDMYAFGTSKKRNMFACRVLLGDIKVYPQGRGDQSLVREPPKPTSRGEKAKTYDSVLGNLHCFNEFVVYNTYRVMPEYIIEYEHSHPQTGEQAASTSLHTSAQTSTSYHYAVTPCVPLCHTCGQLSGSASCLCD